MIKTDVIGHLGMDANLNNVNGKNVINFSIAHTEKFKDNQGVAREKTLWISAAYWTDKTGIAPYLKKGTQVFVTGQPEIGMYQDKQGKWQAEFKLRVNQIQLLGSKDNQSGQQQQSQPSQSAPQSYNDVTEPLDDLPF